MKKIRIAATPPSFAPDHIREQWVGLEMPIKDGMDDDSGLRTGVENAGGYKVHPGDAIIALREAKKIVAYDFWKPRLVGASNLIFKKECCEEI